MQDSIDHALSHHRAGRFPEAEAVYQRILGENPNHADALHLMGILAFQAGRHESALQFIARAISIDATAPEFHAAYAQVLFAMGRTEEAITSYQHALGLRKGMPEAHYNLGCALRAVGRDEEAIATFRTAIALRPDFAEAHNNLGNALRARGEWDEAADCYRRALALQPSHAAAHVNLAQALKATGQLDEAVACFDRALALQPDLAEARSGKIYTLHYHPGCDAARLLHESILWNEQHIRPLRQFRRPHYNDRSADRALRIGYVSPDFRDHVAGRYLRPLLREHDRDKFKVFCYSNVQHPDGFTEQFRGHSHAWRDIRTMTDEQAASLIRDDQIDILVDTALHMGGNRLALFGRAPAPVQATLCAYPGTSGVETIGYRLTDRFLDPPGRADANYSEQSLRLPDSFWCYDPDGDEPAVEKLPAFAAGHITLGCLNNFCKINDGVLTLWAEVMLAVSGSRLLLLAPRGSARDRTLFTLERHGIEPGRVEFVEHQARRKYLETYHRIDLGLDTFPYNGHFTSLDAFWMGVPVVTLVGHTAVGRAGLCLLSNLGLANLAAVSSAKFVQIASNLATHLDDLAALRLDLRNRMRHSPLTDAPRFTRNVESAYQQMWKERRAF